MCKDSGVFGTCFQLLRKLIAIVPHFFPVATNTHFFISQIGDESVVDKFW